MTDEKRQAYDRSWRCLDNEDHPHKAAWAREMAMASTAHETKKHYAGIGLVAWLDEMHRQHVRDEQRQGMFKGLND